MDYLHQFVFGIYPYIAMAIFLLGSLIRFDREQYTWKSDSSQLLHRGSLRAGAATDSLADTRGHPVPYPVADTPAADRVLRCAGGTPRRRARLARPPCRGGRTPRCGR